MNIGPQCPSDSDFTRRMRHHQSWYRCQALGVPCGTGPTPKDTTSYGNMLRQEDGERGLNFLTPTTFEVAKRRLAEETGVIERFRLLNNMLSSQPMCFNLFGPMVTNLALATRVFRQLLPDLVETVVTVAIEYAPMPAEEYLGDRTAFDAFVEFVQPDGRRGFVGIETKLTEPFSQKTYDGPAYRRWSDLPQAPWLAEARDRLPEVRHNQLWRDHLLAVAMQHHPRSEYTNGLCMLVRHPEDTKCAATVAAYCQLLKADDKTFLDCPLDRIVGVIESAITQAAGRKWIGDFRDRYLNLQLSD